MPRPMQTTGRFAALSLVFVLALAACTGSGSPKTSPSGTSGTTGGTTGPPTPTESFSGPPGTALYKYVNAGLTATMQLDGNTGTLEIDNATGRELAKPSFYILDARDGHQVDGTVDGGTTVPDGQTATFDVSYSGLDIKNIGLLVLLMGRDNYGAFVRQ
jgi:hypothetical protein